MRIYSFCEKSYRFEKVEVEIALFPGIPQFQISGLPDAAIKESLLRIQSALRAQGFKLPTRERVYINLRPAYERKSSRGIELAIACAYLWVTEQVNFPEALKELYVYGELGLRGDVDYIDDVDWLPLDESIPILTGQPRYGSVRDLAAIEKLSDLMNFNIESSNKSLYMPSRPELTPRYWSKPAADILKILAVGEHHAFIAGPAGTGKSTFVKSLFELLPDLTEEAWRDIRLWHRESAPAWRPLRMPHHTSTTQALVGGGKPPTPGEVTRASHGLLFLDEFLEFSAPQREALREPMEESEITISRQGKSEKFPADFQLLAATNLCPCGDFVPNKSVNCQRPLNRCRQYLEKMSGPLLDRFDVLGLTHQWRGEDVSIENIFKEVQDARNLLQQWNRKPAAQMSEEEILNSFAVPILPDLLPQSSSRRRQRALLRVARTLADLSGNKHLSMAEVDKAYIWTHKPYYALKEAWG